MILGGGSIRSGGGEPGGDLDDSGHRAPILGGSVPEPMVSPEMMPLYDPVQPLADAAEAAEVAPTEVADAAGNVRAIGTDNLRLSTDQGSGEAGEGLAAGTDNLRLSTDQGGELDDQAETEAKV